MDRRSSLRSLAYRTSNASTSSLDYRNGYPSGSESEAASPGPMKRSRNVHRKEMNSGQKASYQQASKPYSQPYTNQWFDVHYRGGYGSASGSRPASVMSRRSTATIASNCSAMSGLSVITDVTGLTECYASISCSQTTGETQKPQMPENIDAEILNLNTLLETALPTDSNDTEEAQNLKNCMLAFETIRNYAKNHFLDYATAPKLQEMYNLLIKWLEVAGNLNLDDVIKHILVTLATILQKTAKELRQHPQKARNELLLFVQNLGQSGAELMVRYLVPNKEYTKYTLNIILSVFLAYPAWLNCLRQIDDILGIFLRVIKHELQTYREIALSCLYYIVMTRLDLKRKLCDQGGIEVILELLQNDAEERLLRRAAKLLNTLLTINDDDANLYILHHFIDAGGVTVCAKHLNHGSPKLLYALTSCIKRVSDLPETTKTPSWKWENLDHMLRVIGSADYKLDCEILHCLANMTKNHYVKQYLVTYNAPAIFMRMLYSLEDPKWSVMLNSEDSKLAYWAQETYDELMDNTIWALLMLINVYKPPVPNCAPQACLVIINSKDWNVRLMKVLAEGLAEPVNRVLGIIRVLLINCPESRLVVESTIYNNQPMSYWIYVRLNQAIQLLVAPNAALWKQSRLFRGEYSESTVKTPDFKNAITMMITRSIRLMMLLIGYSESGEKSQCEPSSNGDPRQNLDFERICGLLLDPNVTPFHWLGGLLQRQKDDQVKLILQLGIHYINRGKEEFAWILQNAQVCQNVLACCKSSSKGVSEDAKAFYTAAREILTEKGCNLPIV